MLMTNEELPEACVFFTRNELKAYCVPLVIPFGNLVHFEAIWKRMRSTGPGAILVQDLSARRALASNDPPLLVNCALACPYALEPEPPRT